MKKTCLILLIVFLATFIYSGKVIPLPDLVKPWNINVDKTQIYITEGPVVYIYGKGDFKLIKKFGRRGEGPGEFKTNARSLGLELDLFLHPDHLVINSFHRVSLFTRQGEYIKQMDEASGNTFQPLGEKYVGQKYLVDNHVLYNTIWLFDSNFQGIKEIYRFVHGFQARKSFNPFTYYPIVYKTYKNRVFLDGRDVNLYIFDQTGEKAACKLGTEKIQVTDQDRERYTQYFKTHPDWKDFYQRRLRGLLKFPGYFPVIRYFHVADDRIYILTYKEDKGKSEWLILDMKGKLVEKIFLPVSFMNILDIYPYTIEEGKLYQLIENEDEEWELHIVSISE